MRRWTQEDDDLIREDWGKVKCVDIGKKLGVGKTAIIGRAKRIGMPRLKAHFASVSPRTRESRIERSTGEKDLWCAVIFQAFRDATMGRRTDEDDEADCALIRKQARDWLVGKSKDFALVCNLAGMDPDAIFDRASILQKAGWKVRGFHKQKFESVFA